MLYLAGQILQTPIAAKPGSVKSSADTSAGGVLLGCVACAEAAQDLVVEVCRAVDGGDAPVALAAEGVSGVSARGLEVGCRREAGYLGPGRLGDARPDGPGVGLPIGLRAVGRVGRGDGIGDLGAELDAEDLDEMIERAGDVHVGPCSP